MVEVSNHTLPVQQLKPIRVHRFDEIELRFKSYIAGSATETC